MKASSPIPPLGGLPEEISPKFPTSYSFLLLCTKLIVASGMHDVTDRHTVILKIFDNGNHTAKQLLSGNAVTHLQHIYFSLEMLASSTVCIVAHYL